jgi:hypothetical protein
MNGFFHTLSEDKWRRSRKGPPSRARGACLSRIRQELPKEMSPLVEKLEAEFITNLDKGIELIFPLEGAASVNDSPGAIKRLGCRFGFSFLLRGNDRASRGGGAKTKDLDGSRGVAAGGQRPYDIIEVGRVNVIIYDDGVTAGI